MTIRTTPIPRQDLTIHTVKGPVSEGDMHGALEQFYEGAFTNLVLWDLTQADLSGVNSGILQRFIRKSVRLGQQRTNGRTALVAHGDFQFGIGRMYESLHDLESGPFEVRAFRSEEEALSWLTGAASNGD